MRILNLLLLILSAIAVGLASHNMDMWGHSNLAKAGYGFGGIIVGLIITYIYFWIVYWRKQPEE